MKHATGLIGTRFLLLVSHLVLLVAILMDRDANVKSCLPIEHTLEEYTRSDVELSAGLVVSLVLLAMELLGFLTGLSMFASSITLLSIAMHAFATITLTYFSVDVWDCRLFWLVFTLGSVLPTFAEIVFILSAIIVKKVV